MFSLDHIKDIVSRKRAPSHPSEIVLDAIEDCSIILNYSVNKEYLDSFFNGEVPVNLDVASYLGELLGNGSDHWIRLQEVYDLWHLFNNEDSKK